MNTNRFWSITCLFLALALLISPLGGTGSAMAASNAEQPAVSPKVVVAEVSVSQPLSSIKPVVTDQGAVDVPLNLRNRLTMPKAKNDISSGTFDPLAVQTIYGGGGGMPLPTANFDGVGASGSLPPDSNGDIGYDPATRKKYYMQWVNTQLQIWEVTNPLAPVSLYGPTAGNVALFSGMGGICQTNNNGDPIVLYDHLANRWLASQFAFTFAPGNFHQCIAVSATADPLGVWYRYDFLYSTSIFNDYSKFGVWPDGYYMSVNQFDNNNGLAWRGAGAVVFNRTAMLAGAAAMMIYFDVGAVTLNYGGMLPSDLDGPAPAAGTPNAFSEWDDTSWLGDAQDTLRIWNFHVDWVTPANSTFGLASFAPNQLISTSDVDPNLADIVQPGTAQRLDSIPDRLMYRLQYRNFGSYQTLVGNHSVDANGADKGGVHWFELRNSGAGWSLYQDGVYAPDTDSRWMGSVAMDTSGDIALGYSVSSGTTSPSIRYTGRYPADPLGSMIQGEVSMIAGAGSQTHSSGRWGDYSMMAVDPLDDCTFWYTQEYYSATSSASWKTRIGSFRTPVCSTFVDVPVGAFAQTYIESLNTAGITGGCTTIPRNYCPNTSVTRAQMAIFLLRGIHGATYSPPAATGTVFTDVPIGAFGAAWIEQLFAEGITGGCGGGNYCPNASVTRAEMAIFLLRAKYTSAYAPPAATGTVFTDVPIGAFAAAWIERLAAEGITSGCGGTLYCPNAAVTRAQMAVFLVRTFSLP
ncbi:MAG: S-layer homology domain-containing protein [Chloroflexi bacterium]|nr:S-layer homology domain-containing protein [Chloroflexota bacterium]